MMKTKSKRFGMRVFPIFLSALFLLGCTSAAEADSVYADYDAYGLPVYAYTEDTVYIADGAYAAEADAAAAYDVAEVPQAPPIEIPRIVLIPESAPPGYPITIVFNNELQTFSGSIHAELLNANGGRLSRAAFFSVPMENPNHAVKAAIVAIPSTAAFGSVSIRVECSNGISSSLPFYIEAREFQSETIFLDERNTDIRVAPNPLRVQQSQHIWAVFNRTGTAIYSTEAFLRPVEATRRTSPFGARRIFQYVTGGYDMTLHNGIDYGIPIGTDVFSSARGRVVLAHYRIVTGYSIVIEHLPGVYSIYYHMDSLAVVEGELVEAGQFIGESGVTGLATGPHLHWEVRVSGQSADPDAFVARAVLDKAEISRKLFE
ncbi:MAG: M23 family metallopeptidase [Treponema sp.]|nr:M23 family metallopeptidase [Treponema sp.]